MQNSAYTGADTTSHNKNTWITSRLSADAALADGMAHDTLRARSRQLYRSNPIGGAIDQDVDLVVGTGFTPQAKIMTMIDVVTAKQAKKYNQQLEAIGDTVWPRIDISGTMSLWECTRLMQRHLRFDGEALAVLSDKVRKGSKIPLVVEIVDPDRLETPPSEIANPLCRFGVLKDRDGEITHYYIRTTHPGDDKEFKTDYDKVPADRVIHVFEKWFAGQSRGLPWFTRALHRIQDGEDLTEAGIVAAQVEACFVGSITPPPTVGLTPDQIARNMASAVEAVGNIRDMQPGTMRVEMPGTTTTFGSPPHGNNTVAVLQELNYRRIAGALNMAYEMLLKDWRGVSFAGGRLVLQGMRQDVECRQKRLCESWLGRIWCRMVEEAVMFGKCSIPVTSFTQWPEVFTRHKWTPPAWGYAINPLQEVQALVLARDENLITAAEATSSYSGEDYEATVEERAAERQLERDLNVVPPSQDKQAVRQVPSTPPAKEQPQSKAKQLAGKAAV
jgi:lambda family phage portal protein